MNPNPITDKDLLESNSLVRAIAVTMVVVCHLPAAHIFWSPFSPFISGGRLAISLFAFSSGFLLEYLAQMRGFEIRTFLLKRFFRIYPLYWIGLSITLIVATVFNNRIYSIPTIIANFSGAPIWLGSPVISSGYAPNYWFISLIVLCYILFIFTHKFRRKGLLFLGAMLLALVALNFQNTLGINPRVFLAFPTFFLGMFISDRVTSGKRLLSGFFPNVFLIFLFFIILVSVYKPDQFIHISPNYFIYMEILGCLCLSLIAVPLIFVISYGYRLLAKRWARLLKILLWVAEISFAIYCLHEPLYIIVDRITELGHPIAALFAYMAVLITFSWILTAFDERLKSRYRPT